MGKSKKTMIKEALIDQLKKKGVENAVFADLVNDYITFFEVKEALAADVRKRGVTVEDYNSKGLKVTKENPSVKSLQNNSRLMLQVLEKLEALPGKTVPNEEGIDEDL